MSDEGRITHTYGKGRVESETETMPRVIGKTSSLRKDPPAAKREVPAMRQIYTHLRSPGQKNIRLAVLDDPDANNGMNHTYVIGIPYADGDGSANLIIPFQDNAKEDDTMGINDAVLLAIVVDRLQGKLSAGVATHHNTLKVALGNCREALELVKRYLP